MTDARLRVLERPPSPESLEDAGQAIAEWLAPDSADRVEVELRAADGSDIRVERRGDSLTIRGVVLTLRRSETPDALAGARKSYF